MKNLILVLAIVVQSVLLFSQAPQGFNYQAVLRNTDGTIKANETVALQINLVDDNGSSSYMEIHNTQTNELGLINVVIGEGETSEDISIIDWSAKPYYLDITVNGVNLGSSPLLSVPYAMYSETAYRALNDKVVDGDADPTNELQDLSLLAEKTNVLELNNTTEFAPDADYEPATKKYVDDKTKGHYIGEEYGGGIVFWVDETGQHGLIYAKTDQISRVRWYAGSASGSTHAKGDGPFSGETNTAIIIAAQAIADDGSTYAARICNELQITEGGKTYGDWYLPSKDELKIMFRSVGVFILANYWSSTEYNNLEAWTVEFTGHSADGYRQKKDQENRVRAIRAF